MKTLFLVRHAKSSRDDPMLPDKERPLNEHGMHDASRVGEQLAKRGAKPDLILSSPALRALTTAEIVAGKLDYRRKDIGVEDRLYAATPNDLLAVVHELGDKTKRVMLFGHNPELTELAHQVVVERRRARASKCHAPQSQGVLRGTALPPAVPFLSQGNWAVLRYGYSESNPA
jgi:phosphohistidine phosphatase